MTAVDAGHRVVELRQYTTLPDRRDTLVAHFERCFVAPLAAAGAPVIGRYRDLDDADRFVWMRGFASMEARLAALTAFYDGPVWKTHRAAAVATMRETDNVLLLRPPAGADGFAMPDAGGVRLVLIHDLRDVDPDRLADHYAAFALPFLVACGATAPHVLVTESSVNAFTRHPVRTGESVLACFADFADGAALDACLAARRRDDPARTHASDDLLPAFMRKPEVLRLAATAR